MSDDEDPLAELLPVLGGGEGSEHMKELARVLVESERRREEGPPQRVEARQWLAGNGNPHPLAMNHFWTRQDAEQFIEALYAADALRVSADNISYSDVAQYGGSYSDALIVELPSGAAARARIIALCNQHCMADASTGAQFVEEGQSSLYLWWD